MDVDGSPPASRNPRRAAFSSLIGNSLEYYDFFIYGFAAATVFPQVFFPAENQVASTVASLATLGVASVVRPFGAFLWGHLGDTVGRKKILVITLVAMGGATLLIGLLPSYGQIGVTAVILLLVLRVVQGLAVAGEVAGASSITLEHAPDHRRSFYTGSAMAGSQIGNIMATAALALVALLPDRALFSWGWRVPFLLSAVVLFFGWWIRRRLQESPEFMREKALDVVPKAPLKLLFTRHRADVIRVVLAAIASVPTTLFAQFALVFGVHAGLSRSMFLVLALVTYLLTLIVIPVGATLADRCGRKLVFCIGVAGTGAMMWPFFWAISQKNVALVWLFGILMMSLFYGLYLASMLALWNEQFDTQVRMSGVAVGTQIGFAISGVVPAVAAALAGRDLTNYLPVVLLGTGATLISLLAALGMRETYRTPLLDLGRPLRASVPEPTRDPS